MGSEDHDEPSLGIGHKVMLVAAFSLFGMILFIIIFHFCAQYLLRRQQRRRRDEFLHQIRIQIAPIEVSSVDPQLNSGLDPLIIASLPKLLYKETNQFNQGEVMECSVCLGTILEDAITRVLPNCKHIFHVDCVDKWFRANTTCPICRTMVKPMVQPGHGHLAVWVNQVQPTAPPVQVSDEPQDVDELEGVGCSDLRVRSFHRMVSNSMERSLRRTHSSSDSAIVDLERY